MARQLVVDARRADQLAVDAGARRRREVVAHGVPRDDARGVDVDRRSNEVAHAAAVVTPDTPHRREVRLPVEHESLLVDVAIEVDRQLRDPQDRLSASSDA